jgi:hypothetical protein
MSNVQETHVISQMFSAAIKHGRTPGFPDTAKGRLRREPVVRARSEAMLVGSTYRLLVASGAV